MNRENHIITKLVLEIGLPTKDVAFGIQNKLSENYKHLVLNVIEEVFDRMVGVNEKIQIDKLEIDLGNISMGELDYKIPEKIKTEMEEALTKVIYEIRNSPNGNSNVRIITSSGDTISVNANLKQDSSSVFDTLIYFLQYGVLPWSEDRTEKLSLREMVAEAMEKNPDQLRHALQQLSGKQYIFRRLAQQLPEDQAQYLTAILGCGFSSQLLQLSNQIQKWLDDFFRRNKTLKKQKSFFPNELKQKITEETLLYFSSLQNESFKANGKRMGESVSLYVFFILEKIFNKVEIDPDRNAIKSVKGKFDGALENALQQFVKNKGEKKTEKEKQEGEKNKTNKNEEQLPETPETDEGIYIANAGLVIIAPYLTNFFSNLNLIKDRQFINDKSKYKAVHLLQWMVYGDEKKQSEKNEHDLALNKIICGIDIAEPIPVSFELSESEKENCTELLEAVIANWAIIKRSSVHSLRITFLQKEGKLKRQSRDWNLFIHRDFGVEILIDRLPWPISILRFQWSKETIFTQW